MENLENLHYVNQLKSLVTREKYELMQLYADYIDPDAYLLDLDSLLCGRSPKEAVEFMYDHDLTPYAENYWWASWGSIEEGTIEDYVETWYDESFILDLIDTVGIDTVNKELSSFQLEVYEEEEDEE